MSEEQCPPDEVPLGDSAALDGSPAASLYAWDRMSMKSRRNPVDTANGGPLPGTFEEDSPVVSDGSAQLSLGDRDAGPGKERLRLDVSHDQLHRLVRRYFEGTMLEDPNHRLSGEEHSGPEAHETELTIRLHLVEDDRPAPSGDCFERWSGVHPRFTVRLGHRLEVMVDIDAAVIDGWVFASLLDTSPETAGRLLVEAPLAAVRAGHGWQVVHAATVVGPGGVVAIRGASDAGKSTLAAAAWRAGLETLGDESILVRRPVHEEIVASVREILVRPWTAEALDLEGDPFVTPDGEPKLRLRLPPIPAAGRTGVHAATVLLGAIKRPGGARMVSLTPEEFVGEFGAGAIPQEHWYGSPELLVRDWANRPAYRLEGAADLDGAVDLLGRLSRGESF